MLEFPLLPRYRPEFLIVEDARNSVAAIPDSVNCARAFALCDRLAWHLFATSSGAAGNRSRDAPVRHLWRLAPEELSSENNEAILLNMPDLKLDFLRHLHVAAVKKRTECENKKWKIELNGRQIILWDVAEKIIVCIDKVKQIGDIVVNYDIVAMGRDKILAGGQSMMTLKGNRRTETDV